MILSGNVIVEPLPRMESPLSAPVRSRPLMASALALIGIFAIADVCSRGVIVPVLYAVPLVLLARAGYANWLRWITAALVLIVYAAYFAKFVVHPSVHVVHPFDYRLVNRTFVVVAICMLEVLLKLRVSTESLRGDVELPETLRHEEDETDETLAILLCVGLTTAIALVDFLSPANYNLAILYMVPLFLCAWIRSRRLLWGMWGVAMVLTVLGFLWGPAPTVAHAHLGFMVVNRVLAAMVMTLLAVLLHFQIAGNRIAVSRFSDSRRQSGNPA
jgi:hypothetical protein